jgi:hypothetical protein
MGEPGGWVRSSEGAEAARIQVLVAEYTWVSGLIRYYREVELKALAGTGLVLSGVGAAFAALHASQNDQAVHAIGIVFAIAAAITAFALPVVVMANLRGMRAVVYLREWLHPLAAELTGDARFLAWEAVAPPMAVMVADGFGELLKAVVSSTVVVFLIAAASLLLAVAGATVEHTVWSRAIAAAAGAADVVFFCLALRLASLSHAGSGPPPERIGELECTAATSARWPKVDGSA